jgi:hypothetical protein
MKWYGKRFHCLLFFYFYHQLNLVRGSVLTSSGSISLLIAVAGDRTVVLSLPNSASIIIEPINDWLDFKIWIEWCGTWWIHSIPFRYFLLFFFPPNLECMRWNESS